MDRGEDPDFFCPKPMLNANQKRFLTVTLREVEDRLRRLQGLLQEGQEGRLFSHLRDDIGQGEKGLLNEKIEHLKACLAQLKKLLDLSETGFVLKDIVKATSVFISILLEEAMSDRLRAYGEIREGLKETLDLRLKEMKAVLRQMESIV